MVTELFRPVLDDGLRSINFFNGRLLSGEDLSQDQAANREAERRLGRTVGEGIAFGLQVVEAVGVSSPSRPVVTVRQGLALNRCGQTLSLPADTDVSLVPPANGNGAVPASLVFAECQPSPSSAYVSGAGVYLLTLAPASGAEGRAPVSGLGNTGAACNARYNVAGVQFRSIPLDLTANELSDAAHLRNNLAYQCFGAQRLASLARNPFGPPLESYGLLDDLRPNRLTDCDVPLAIIAWALPAGISFVDRWAVQRRLTPPSPAERWNPLIGSRRLSESDAMFLQFQDHIQDIQANEVNLPAIVAADRFEYLPPVGLLPMVGSGSPTGFDPLVFFGAQASENLPLLNGNLLRELLNEARFHEPISLSSGDPIQLYRIWENVQAVESGSVTQLGLVFASGALPYRGVARFDEAQWDSDRFASSVI